jgi:ABC-2 type transport system permease protein
MSAPAPATARVLGQARFEAGTLLRNGEQLLVSVVLPLGALVGLAFTSVPSLGDGRRIDVATPGVLALCVVSAAFTSQAIATGFDRRASVLRLFGTTPLGRSGLLWGKALATLGVEVLQWCLVGGVGLALGWRPDVGGLPYAVLFLLLAGTLRAEGVLAVANLVWVLLLVAGGIVVPRTELPSAVSGVVAALPSAALGDGLRAAFGNGTLLVGPVLVLVVWAAIATALTAWTFRWSD